MAEHGIEVGGARGRGTAPIWRIGLMGRTATAATAERVIGALDSALAADPALAAA